LFKENELEDAHASVARYKPRPIEELVKATRFSRKEIQHMYRGFKQVNRLQMFLIFENYFNLEFFIKECPSGIVNEQMFKEIYAQFFPQGGMFHFIFDS